LAFSLLQELERLDQLEILAQPLPDLGKENSTLDSPSDSTPMESYSKNCFFIIQWLFLSSINRIKPVCYALARHPDIYSWFNIISADQLASTKIHKSPSVSFQCQNTLLSPPNHPCPHTKSTQQHQQLPTHNFINQKFIPSDTDMIQQLTVKTLMEMKESLESSRI
jgi:hypothetical protein